MMLTIKKRYTEKDVLVLMVLQFFNPLSPLAYPTWLFATASAQKKNSLKNSIISKIERLHDGYVELSGQNKDEGDENE
jgi:hypothetical protein